MGEEGGWWRVREVELWSWLFRIDPFAAACGPVCFPTLSKTGRKKLQVVVLGSCLRNRWGLKCGRPIRLWTRW